MENSSADVARHFGEWRVVIWHGSARTIFDRTEPLQRRCQYDPSSDAERIRCDTAVLLRRQIVRLNDGVLARIGGTQSDEATACRLEVTNAGGERRERVQRIA